LGFEFPTNPYPAFHVPKKCQRLPHQTGFGLWVKVLGYGAGLWFWVWVMVILGYGFGSGLWLWVWVRVRVRVRVVAELLSRMHGT
jgi:hypothetical protein